MDNFFCTRCRELICEDCQLVALEYKELYEAQKRSLIGAELRMEKLVRENERLKREAAMWEETARTGLPDKIQAWMDDQGLEKTVKAIRAAQSRSEVGG